MLNKNLIIAGSISLFALAACFSDEGSTAGAAIEPNAIAENSSSSVDVSSSSEEIASSSSAAGDVQDIVFSTKATMKMPLRQGEVVVYGEEKGAMASCFAGKSSNTKSYTAKISVIDGHKMERTLSLKNFGSDCDSIYQAFKDSCPSDFLLIASDAACSETKGNNQGNLKVSCFASATASNMLCDNQGKCSLAKDTSSVDFDAIVEEFTKESDDICSHIANGVDSTEYTIPVSEPDSSIRANSGRTFILEPNTDKLDVTDEERVILDSLARAYPEKRIKDEIDGTTIVLNYGADYTFTTEGKKFIQSTSSCEGNIYEEESGVRRENTFYHPYGFLYATTFRSDDAIVYLIRGRYLDATAAKIISDLFDEECDATNGSFHDYYPYETRPAMACAVKNFTGTPFSTIVSEQANFCEITHMKYEQPIAD